MQIVTRAVTRAHIAMLTVTDDDPRIAAPLTWLPVRFDGVEPPHNWMLRKYVCVVFGVAQLSSEPVEPSQPR
jgi:hypothetical protein